MFKLKTTLIAVMIFAVSLSTFGKTTKSNELRFQLGFGGYVNTCNLMGLIENAKMIDAIQKDSAPTNMIGLTDDQAKAYSDMSKAMRSAVVVTNILGSLEYGLKARILWHVLIAEADLALLPFDGSYNGRLDMMLNVGAGVRAPFWIMPYATLGAVFTFSWYPEDAVKVESWKQGAVFKNFAFTPGLQAKLGLDFKFKGFSIGAHYQWTVKDFYEFGGYFAELTSELSTDPASAVGTILGYQSRLGVDFVFYLF